MSCRIDARCDIRAGSTSLTKRTIIATAAAIFAAWQLRHRGPCRWRQVRRRQRLQGQSACKGPPSQGQNACKGRGWSEAPPRRRTAPRAARSLANTGAGPTSAARVPAGAAAEPASGAPFSSSASVVRFRRAELYFRRRAGIIADSDAYTQESGGMNTKIMVATAGSSVCRRHRSPPRMRQAPSSVPAQTPARVRSSCKSQLSSSCKGQNLPARAEAGRR